MDDSLIQKYLLQFKKLNRGYSKGLGKAPHKPILLLSLVRLFSKGLINTNKIFITSDLVLTFRDLWKKLVLTNHTENFALPFFHMRSEPFWNLVEKIDGKIGVTRSKSIKSFKNLNENVAFAEINKDLFHILNDPISRAIVESFLLDEYFPGRASIYSEDFNNVEESQIEYEILNSTSKEYKEKLIALKNSMKEEQFEEEVFVRGGMFKKRIPEIYDNTCSISGMQIFSNHNIQMIDACHLYPISLSNDDTIPNGIALSPNIHRAFDRGLLTINTDYIVRISPSIEENETSFSLSQFEGKQIILPEKESFYPSPEYLNWHNKEVFLL